MRGGACAAEEGGCRAAIVLARRGLRWLVGRCAPRCGARRRMCCRRWRLSGRHRARSTRAALASTLMRATVRCVWIACEPPAAAAAVAARLAAHLPGRRVPLEWGASMTTRSLSPRRSRAIPKDPDIVGGRRGLVPRVAGGGAARRSRAHGRGRARALAGGAVVNRHRALALLRGLIGGPP